MDFRKRQTIAASPAEPGDLPHGLVVPRGDAGVKREGASEDRIIANSFKLEQQSALSLPGSRRTPQARHRNWSNPGRQIHGKAQATPISFRNHADGIASLDLFVVPTLSFRLLYGLVILRHGRRQILGLGMAARPTAEWMARQLTEACGRKCPPRYIVRDRSITADRIYHGQARAIQSPHWGSCAKARDFDARVRLRSSSFHCEWRVTVAMPRKGPIGPIRDPAPLAMVPKS